MILQFIPRVLKNEIRACCINVLLMYFRRQILSSSWRTPQTLGPHPLLPLRTPQRNSGQTSRAWRIYTSPLPQTLTPSFRITSLPLSCFMHLVSTSTVCFYFFYRLNFCSKNQIDNIFYMYCSHEYSTATFS